MSRNGTNAAEAGARLAANLAAGVAASVCGTGVAALAGRNRSGRRPQARRLALHLAHVGLGASLTQAARALGRDRAAARRACASIEEQREALQWDQALDGLERALRVWIAAFCTTARIRP